MRNKGRIKMTIYIIIAIVLVAGFMANSVAALLICPNPALNYCRKLLMPFAV